MQFIVCSRCGHSTARTSAYSIDGAVYCETCGLAEWEGRSDAVRAQSSLVKIADPTVCSRCEADHGAETLPLLGGEPTCVMCLDAARRYPFPAWVRLSFVALLLLAALSFAFHLRFLRGYMELTRANKMIAHEDLDGAVAAITAAASHVPESPQLQAVSAFYRGLALLRDDHSVEALPLLQIARGGLDDPSLDRVVLHAEAGAAFDLKDYDRFLDRMQAVAKLEPGEAMAEAGVASAWACKFAVSGDTSFEREALAHLESGRKLSHGDTPGFQEYEQRIRHRLATREILSRAQYLKRMKG